jgi:hypothetical protein
MVSTAFPHIALFYVTVCYALISLSAPLATYHRKNKAREISRKHYKTKKGSKDGKIEQRK